MELAAEVPEAIGLDAAAVAGRIGMGIGSVEYLLDESGQVWFIDINPVSSYHPEVKERLGFDPWQRQSAWLLQSV